MYEDKHETTMLFNFRNNGVRVVMLDGEAWFSVNDLCAVLGIKRGRATVGKALRNSEVRREFISATFRRGGTVQEGYRKMYVTNESGVYALIMRSNKPEAQEFRFWVTNTVLPSIRKTGSYAMEQEQMQLPLDMPGKPEPEEKKPCVMTFTAGTRKLSVVVSFSSDNMLDSHQVSELYDFSVELLNKAALLSLRE